MWNGLWVTGPPRASHRWETAVYIEESESGKSRTGANEGTTGDLDGEVGRGSFQKIPGGYVRASGPLSFCGAAAGLWSICWAGASHPQRVRRVCPPRCGSSWAP